MGPVNLFSADVRVYIAGVLMPHISVNVVSGANTIPRCTISIPPDPRLFGIGRHDRIPVHVFVRNSMSEFDDFILLFEGEIIGSGYFNNEAGREFVINGQGHLGFLKDLNIKLLLKDDDYVTAGVPGQVLKALNVSQTESIFPLSLFMYGIGSVSDDNLIKTPTGFLDNIVKFLSGNYNKSAAIRSILSQYFEKRTKLLKLADRYVALPFFDESMIWDDGGQSATFPLLSGIKTSSAVQLLSGMLSNGPHTASIYDLVNYVVSNMEYEFAFFTSPAFLEDKLISMCLKPLFHEAYPPMCNVLFRSMIGRITCNEPAIYPTRVRVDDVFGTFNVVSGQQDNTPVKDYGRISFYPCDTSVSDKPVDSNKDLLVSLILNNELFTGPRMVELPAPMWFSYIDTKTGEDLSKLKSRVISSIYQLVGYEQRTASVSSIFNPYVTPGFPGVFYDTDDPEITFIGHVLSVSHTLTKKAMQTQIDVGFVRTLDEELFTPLNNSYKPVSDKVTRSIKNISTIYQALLGCDAMSVLKASEMESAGIPQHNDPKEAFAYCRRDIVTFDKYCRFMEITPNYICKDSNGDDVPRLLMAKEYLENRNILPVGMEVRKVLQDIANKIFDSEIYS